jgi:hypothetical protein
VLDSFDVLVFALSTGIGLMTFGVGQVLCRGRNARGILAAVAACLVLAGSWSVSPRAAYVESLAAAAVAALAAVVWLLRRSPATYVSGFLVRPAVIAAILVTGGAGLIAAGSWHYDSVWGDDREREIEFMEKMAVWHPDLEAADIEVKTDDGRAVTVFSATAPRAKPKVREDEAALLAGFDWGKRVIQRGPGDDVSNCHGWVFTGGKYWVKGHDVPTILSGNGYRAQKFPRVGDVAAYFDDAGRIAHTGLVRSVGAVTMVESKWGWMGVYLHAAEDSCYGTKIVYYHGTRKGPQLAAINPSDAEPAPRFGRTNGERPPIR